MGKKIFLSKEIFGLCLVVFGISLLCSCKPLHKDTFVISGTYLEITSPDNRAAAIVHAEFKRLDKIFNFYDPQSELSKLNNTYNTPFKASKELIEVLKLSQDVYRMSNGAFDPSYGALYSFWKGLIKAGNIKELPSKEKIEELKQLGGMQNIEINEKNQTILLKKQGLKIDLSAIAEGYMVDKAILKLKEKAVKNAIINAGGDIYCLGNDKGRPWKVGIENPKEMEGIIEYQTLIEEGIATSGNNQQFFTLGGKRYSHLINPHTGYAVDNDILSVSIIAKNCTTADSFSTAFFVMGLEGIKDFLSKNPSTMRIFVVIWDKSGKHVHKFGPVIEPRPIQ